MKTQTNSRKIYGEQTILGNFKMPPFCFETETDTLGKIFTNSPQVKKFFLRTKKFSLSKQLTITKMIEYCQQLSRFMIKLLAVHNTPNPLWYGPEFVVRAKHH